MTRIFIFEYLANKQITEYGIEKKCNCTSENCPVSEGYLTTDKMSQFIVYTVFNTAIMSSNSCHILKIIIICEEWSVL